MPNIFKKPVAIDRGTYAMAMQDGQNAEIFMYGEIVEQQPTDWWGDPIPGDYIIQGQFLQDLEAVSKAKSLTIRMNSLGGDAGVSILIHNRLRELAAKGTALTCIVDGVAMSGGSHIMCACDTVKVNPSSLIAIHNCWSTIRGAYNAKELRELAASFEAWDKAQISVYKRKCGLDEQEITRMMAETTYMTGQEAVDKGFADSLIEDAEPLNLAASADGRSLFVRGREFHLCPGVFAPDSIPTVCEGADNTGEHTKIQEVVEQALEARARPRRSYDGAKSEATPSGQPPVANKSEGGNEIMANITTPVPVAQEPARIDQVAAERQRLKEIDAIASLYPAELVQAAKYGENPCTAQELAYQAAMAAVTTEVRMSGAFLADMLADGQSADQVGAAPVGEPQANEDSPQAAAAQAKADVEAFKKMKEVR